MVSCGKIPLPWLRWRIFCASLNREFSISEFCCLRLSSNALRQGLLMVRVKGYCRTRRRPGRLRVRPIHAMRISDVAEPAPGGSKKWLT
jgi:hypothetical protein